MVRRIPGQQPLPPTSHQTPTVPGNLQYNISVVDANGGIGSWTAESPFASIYPPQTIFTAERLPSPKASRCSKSTVAIIAALAVSILFLRYSYNWLKF